MKSLMDKKLLVEFSRIISNKLAPIHDAQDENFSLEIDQMEVYKDLRKILVDFMMCSLDGHRLTDMELESLYEEIINIYTRIASAFGMIELVKEYLTKPQKRTWTSKLDPDVVYAIAKNDLDNEFCELYIICKKIVREYSIDEFTRA